MESAALLDRCRRARGAESGRLRRAASVAGAWPPRGGHALPRSEQRAGTGTTQRWAGETRAGLGWAEARWAGTCAGVRWAGFGRGPASAVGRLRPWAEKRGGGP